MELAIDGDRPVQADIVRQACVATDNPCLAAAYYRSIEVDNLAVSVNARISAAGALYSNRCIGDCCKSVLQHILESNYTR